MTWLECSLLLVLASACAEPDVPELPLEIAAAPTLPRQHESGEEALYDAEGELLESSSRLAGLVLPRGLELVLEEERRHVYESPVPLIKMQRYFGIRLLTGQVDPVPGGGVTYVDALPRDVRGGQVRLDVTIEPSSRSPSRVEIIERRPPPVSAPPEAESLERLRERLRRAD